MRKWLEYSFIANPANGQAFRCAAFRILYKVHKAVLGYRPVTGNFCSASQPSARLLAFLLLPMVRATPEYVKDGDDVNRLLQKTHLPTDCLLITYDVVSLYPSILHEKCLDAIRTHCQRRNWSCNDFPYTDLCVTILKMVLSVNYCMFLGIVYLQRIGFATGVACGGAAAKLLIYFYTNFSCICYLILTNTSHYIVVILTMV